MHKLTLLALALLLLAALTGCAGTKMLRNPEPLLSNQPLAAASDERLAVFLDAVIFRAGPGSWAKNVDWDEYLINVENLDGEPIEVTSMRVIDSLGTRVEPRVTRGQLVSATKVTKRRYQGQGLKVKAGTNAGVLLGVSVAAAAGTTGVGTAAMAGGGAAAGAAAVVIMVPVLAVGGVVRGVNNSRVNQQIKSRQTILPVVLQAQQKFQLHIFFPLAPSPQQLEVGYLNSLGRHTLVVDTQAVLSGLHIERPRQN